MAGDVKDEKKKKKKKAKGDKAKSGKKGKKGKAQAAPASAPAVSPLAPASFPAIPPIAGVEFASAAAGVRYAGRTDVMLARLAPGTTLAGVFTKSSTRSAPVLDGQAKLGAASRAGAAFIVNSGNSNAFTGAGGLESVSAVTKALADRLNIPPVRVLMSSTGVIGEPLPHDRIVAKLDALVRGLSDSGIEGAARAIMTTDTFPKGAVAKAEIGGVEVTVAGIAKGSGMIAPDMATMLGYIFTDAAVERDVLQRMLVSVTDETFNCITVDSDTSTSDTVLLAATGKSGAPVISDARTRDAQAFKAALVEVMGDLARQIVRDGEGATKFVTVNVAGAVSVADARKVARAIADSPLVKTAIAGEDPNWGRIGMAVGKSGAKADRDKLTIRFGEVLVAENGWVAPGYAEALGAAEMKKDEIEINVDLGLGSRSAHCWTCDLTARYIAINADYRS
jgi:glutamate N-acetyltransferase/amino-acid N-acetyltransferase